MCGSAYLLMFATSSCFEDFALTDSIDDVMCLDCPRAAIKPREHLAPLVKRSEALIIKTPPNGPEYLQLLRHILERERLWRR